MTARTNHAAIILGGGPAGVSCALELADSMVDYLLIERRERLGGQLPEIPSAIPNFAGGRFDNGEALRANLEEAAAAANINCLMNRSVTAVDLKGKEVMVGGDVFAAQTMVLATGHRFARLGLPGEDSLKPDVSYRPEPPLEHFQGKNVAVVGGGDSAALATLALAPLCPRVYLIHRSDRLRARPDLLRQIESAANIEIRLNTTVESLSAASDDGCARLSGIAVRHHQSLEISKLDVTRLCVRIGYTPNTELFAGQLEMTEKGYLRIGQDCSTSAAGIFAAGDIAAPGYDRIAAAIGHGATAAQSVRRFLGHI